MWVVLAVPLLLLVLPLALHRIEESVRATVPRVPVVPAPRRPRLTVVPQRA